ncbi:MAG: sigma-54-dependent Fis family transcriptional regulator [Gulosibacter sp.]|uniref:sigma-54-dependent Fis family transcriptional regulator n=1 Tax=Gulosibacter sp. TaxID=2817531 RepID=UPI003F93F710
MTFPERHERPPARIGELSNSSILALREEFLAAPEETDLSALRPVIARSWQRSLAGNVNSDRLFLRSSDPRTDEQLLLAAEPVLTDLERLCLDVGGAVVLTDADGTLAVFRGDTVARKRAELLYPLVGAQMSEELIGTNSDGTAIEEGEAIQVWGAEHFNEGLQDGYCTSVPIRDPIRRSIRGVLGVMLPERVAKDVDPRSIMLTVTGAAADITRRLAERLAAREQALMSEYMREVRKRGADAVVAMDERTTIASRRALSILDQSDFSVLAAIAKEAEKEQWALQRRISVSTGQEVLVHARPMNLTALDSAHATVMRVNVPSHPAMTGGISLSRERGVKFSDFVGSSWTLQRALNAASTAVSRKMPAYIVGEPGTGKRRLARAMASMLASDTLFFDCSRTKSDSCLVERVDKFLAEGGSVLLHRIEHATAECRDELASLLNILEQPQLIVTTTAVTDELLPLLAALRGIEVSMPPLRSRREDIPDLAVSFLREALGTTSMLSAKLRDTLVAADWPGNLAQLRDVMSSVQSDSVVGEVRLSDLPEIHLRALTTARLTRLEEAELHQIRSALVEVEGNRARAAALLGIGRSTLYRKIEAYEGRGFNLELN